MNGVKAQGCKRGQFGLLDAASYLLYLIGVLVIVLFLNIGGCVIKNKEAKAGIMAEVNLASSLKADAQLDSYLRTDVVLPDKAELFAKLDWFEKNKNTKYIKELVSQLKIDVAKVKDFLDRHPEAYADKDYSGFISSLHAFYASGNKNDKEDAERAFKAVTAAMFLRAVEDYPKRGEYVFYLLPIGVDFNPKDFKPSEKEDLCKVSELCAYYLPSEVIPEIENPLVYIPPYKFSSQAVQVIPLADSTLAKVEFRYYPEFKSWLPNA